MNNDVRTIKHILITVILAAGLWLMVVSVQGSGRDADDRRQHLQHCIDYPYATDCR